MLGMTWCAAHMNEADKAEIMCQLPKTMSCAAAGELMFKIAPDGWKWEVTYRSEPVAVFGFSPINAACWSVWSYGTRRMWRAVPAMSKHFLAQKERLLDFGVRRLEARSLIQHRRAFMWLTHMGGKRVCNLPQFGRDGETFVLWEWTKD